MSPLGSLILRAMRIASLLAAGFVFLAIVIEIAKRSLADGLGGMASRDFAFMGVLNLVVAFNFLTATWVNFKLFAGTGLMIAFVIGQTMFLSKYLKDAP